MNKRNSWVNAAVLTLCLLLPTIASGATATLVWKDNSTDEDGFRIFRKLPADPDFVLIATTAANETKFVDATSVEGACYKLKAFNASGESAFSNTACALFAPGNLILLLVLP